VGQKRVPAKYLLSYEFPLPPTDEQERIVAKLDAALSRVERGEAVLRRAHERLQRYRSAVLEGAVRGDLTHGWRTAHQKQEDGNETGEALLRRVLAARRARWEEGEVRRFREKGKLPTDEHWKTRYREPGPPDTIDFELPETWARASLEMVAEIGSGISVSQNRVLKNGIELPYLRVANVLRGRLDLSDIKTMRVEQDRAPEYSLQINDVLFTEGGDRDKLGRGWVWEGQIPRCVHQNHVFRVRLADPLLLNPRLVSHWGNTFGQNFFLKHGKQTTNLASINRRVLGNLPVPIIPVAEQAEILREVDRRLTAADKLRVALQQQFERLRATRQALREQAFAGHLVPQDPNDEPASVLLGLIRGAREAEAQKPKAKRMPRSESNVKATRLPNMLTVLEENGRPMTPEELFRASGHSQESVDEFFAELRELTATPAKIVEQRSAGRVTLLKAAT
jgi:type I restriction enzyme, S subunit